jgi:hypothetical protein
MNHLSASTPADKVVQLDIVIPTLGERLSLLDVIATLRLLSERHERLKVRVFVSFNPRSATGQKVFLDKNAVNPPNFEVTAIGPSSYQKSSEHHLLWCLGWYRQIKSAPDAYLWPLTDNDPIIASGFRALIDFLRKETPDLFYVNNLWGDTLGEPLPSPAFPTNQMVWHGSASMFFRSLGFEHATSAIGTFFLRSEFLTGEIVRMLEDTIQRSEVCAHAWWMFEAASCSQKFYFMATPLLVNKFNRHNFDDAPTWKENAQRNNVPSRHPWSVGYLRQLEFYVAKGILTYEELRTSMISEPQRGILPFLDDVLRQLFAQADLALRNESERLDEDDIAIIKRMFGSVYPLRMPMIEHLCLVLAGANRDARVRLLGYKLAHKFLGVEQQMGTFLILFRNAAHGYYIFEHNVGFVALLRKFEAHRAYRDLDPVDVYPFILYAPTEEEIRAKIAKARLDVRPQIFMDNFDYFGVTLREPHNPILAFPNAQISIWSLPAFVRRRIMAVLLAGGRVVRFLRRVRERLS